MYKRRYMILYRVVVVVVVVKIFEQKRNATGTCDVRQHTAIIEYVCGIRDDFTLDLHTHARACEHSNNIFILGRVKFFGVSMYTAYIGAYVARFIRVLLTSTLCVCM